MLIDISHRPFISHCRRADIRWRIAELDDKRRRVQHVEVISQINVNPHRWWLIVQRHSAGFGVCLACYLSRSSEPRRRMVAEDDMFGWSKHKDRRFLRWV